MRTGRKLIGGLVACVATLTVGAVMVLLPGEANAGPAPSALVLEVDTLVDDFDFDDTDGLCDDGPDGACSLREAVAVAAANGGGTIVFVVDGTVVLTEEIYVFDGGDISITGNGVTSTVISVQPPVDTFRGRTKEYRHFFLERTDLTVEDLTLRDGEAGRGGSVYLSYLGALTTEDVHFLDNTARGDGGAVFADADNDTLDVRSTTFAGNEAFTGGAIFVDDDTATIVNSTFTDNGAVAGAAIYVHWQGTLDISWSTFSGNVLTGEEGEEEVEERAFQGIRSSAAVPAGFGPDEYAAIVAGQPGKGDGMADVTISHSILEKTTGFRTDECGGPIVSGGANIVDDTSCGFVSALDVESTPANVGPLQDNGGATFTMALASDSAAVDVDTALCKLNDQRDLPRNTDGDGDGTAACDSGAYELQEATDEPTTSTSAPDGGVGAGTARPATPTVARPTFTG